MGKISFGVNMEFVRHDGQAVRVGRREGGRDWATNTSSRWSIWGRELLSEAGYFHSVSMLDDPLRIQTRVREAGVKLSGLSAHTPLCKPEIGVEYLKQAIRFAAECGAPVVNTDEGPKQPWTTEDEDHVLMRYTLMEAAAVAEPRGILDRPRAAPAIQQDRRRPGPHLRAGQIPAIGINFDTGNSYLAATTRTSGSSASSAAWCTCTPRTSSRSSRTPSAAR